MSPLAAVKVLRQTFAEPVDIASLAIARIFFGGVAKINPDWLAIAL